MMRLEAKPGLKVTTAQIKKSKPFIDWAKQVGANTRGTITVTDVSVWGGEIHSLQATIALAGAPWPDKVILRSPTVDVLTILTDGRQQYVALVEQYRPAVGMSVLSNPAGGMGWDEQCYAAAVREVREELGLSSSVPVKCNLLQRRPLLASPGVTNERTYMVRATIQLTAPRLKAMVAQLQGKKTGLASEGEHITLHVVPLQQARKRVVKETYPDAKTLLSFGLAGI